MRSADNRITAAVRARNAAGQGAFVPFLVIGDPDFETSLVLAKALVQAGADALELGFAFSDPPADGPVIQRADERALAAGITPPRAFDLIEALQKTHAIPVSLLVYYNLVLQFGVDAFYARAAAAGVDAVLVADLPPEHAADAVRAAKRHGVAPVFLASELSPPARLERIAALAEGYVYALARVGVTGEQRAIDPNLAAALERMRAATDLPLLAGFGIGGPAQALAARRAGADGVIVGSAIVRRVADHLDDRPAMIEAVRATAAALADAAHAPIEPKQKSPMPSGAVPC